MTTERVYLTESEQQKYETAITGKEKDRIRHAAQNKAQKKWEKEYAKEHGQYPGYSGTPQFVALPRNMMPADTSKRAQKEP